MLNGLASDASTAVTRELISGVGATCSDKKTVFHKVHPVIGRSRFWREDVHWYGVGKDVDLSYDSHSLAFLLSGSSQRDEDLYVMINAYWEELLFTIQEGQVSDWQRVIDTSLPSPRIFASFGRSKGRSD
jgi:isoamylase